MPQDTTLPDPEQLKTWAREMLPFTDDFNEMALDDDAYLCRTDVADAFEVEYRYRPSYINVETAPEEWHRADDVSWADITYTQAWNQRLHADWAEDYVSAQGMCSHPSDPAQYSAVWILETTTVTRYEA